MKVRKHALEFPVKFSWPFPQDATASAWVLTVECIQLCVFLTFLTDNSILIWPKLPMSGSSSMIIYTEKIQTDPSAVAYTSMLLICSSLENENLLSTQFPASYTSFYGSIAFVLLAKTTVELLGRCSSPQISYGWEKRAYLPLPFFISVCMPPTIKQISVLWLVGEKFMWEECYATLVLNLLFSAFKSRFKQRLRKTAL